jgi:glycosyltransferase involved in cell wall biosynthesis
MDKRILVITQYGVGSPYAGNRARMHRLFEDLREIGYAIHLADVLMPDTEVHTTLPYVDAHVHRFKRAAANRSLQSRIQAKLRNTIFNLRKQNPDELSVDRWFLPHWLAEAKALQDREKYTRIMVEYVFCSKFLTAFGDDCLKIIDTHDSFANRNSRMAEKGVTFSWFDTTTEGERIGLLRADRIIAIQDLERTYFEELLANKRKVFTVGHRCVVELEDMPTNNDTVGYLGSNNPYNIDGLRWFLEHVWPRILSVRPETKLLIAGPVCEAKWSGLNVEVMGVVNSLRDFYRKCSVAINPVQAGTGLKIKTIEALAHGRIVIGTDIAFDGLAPYVTNLDCIANEPQGFADCVVKHLTNSVDRIGEYNQAFRVVNDLNLQWKSALIAALQ